MPLPERAIEFVDTALAALKTEGGWAHFQDFVYAGPEEDPVKVSRERLMAKMKELGSDFELLNSRIVRDVGPRWYHVATDLFVENP